MTARPELLALAREIEEHLDRVQLVVDTTAKLAAKHPPDLAGTWAIAAHLHSFYTGCEAIILRALEPFDGPPPPAPDSHARLLWRARLEVPELRPPVLRDETAHLLDRYRAFRHFFRHAYGVTLEWELMAEKVRDLAGVHARFAADVHGFLVFLRAAGQAGGDAAAS